MNNNSKYLAFKVFNEYDLHTKVVQYIRRFYPEAIFTPNLGELQNTSCKRISSYRKGYQNGQPDIIINNKNHRFYNGLCIKFKTPKNTGVLSDAQRNQLEAYENVFKCILSNDYDYIITQIHDYMKDTRI